MEQVLTTDTAALREKQAIINQLKVEVKQKGKQAIIEEVAYTWFNRLCALRYMDVNHYTQVGIVSPSAGFTQPEILQQAKQGLIEPGWQLDCKRVSGLLNAASLPPMATRKLTACCWWQPATATPARWTSCSRLSRTSPSC